MPFPKTVATKPLRNSGSDSLEELEALNIREFSDDSDSDSEDLDLSDPEGLTKTIEAFKSAQRRASLAQGNCDLYEILKAMYRLGACRQDVRSKGSTSVFFDSQGRS